MQHDSPVLRILDIEPILNEMDGLKLWSVRADALKEELGFILESAITGEYTVLDFDMEKRITKMAKAALERYKNIIEYSNENFEAGLENNFDNAFLDKDYLDYGFMKEFVPTSKAYNFIYNLLEAIFYYIYLEKGFKEVGNFAITFERRTFPHVTWGQNFKVNRFLFCVDIEPI